MKIWTIGHSTRSIDDFISLLKKNEIKLLADVRSLPGSKRYPQFNREALAESLNAHGIRYEHFPELGGRRKAGKDSHNKGLAQRFISRLCRSHGNRRISHRR